MSDDARTVRTSGERPSALEVLPPGNRTVEVPGSFRVSVTSFEPALVQLQRKSQLGPAIAEDAPAGRTTTLSTSMNLITVMVGAGVLAFPKFFGMAGWYLGPLVLLAAAASSMEAGRAFVEALRLTEAKLRAGARFSFTRPDKYEDAVEAAFGAGGKTAAGVLLNVFMLLICGCFMMLIGASLHAISPGWEVKTWVLASCVLFGPLSLLRDMDFISRLSSVGVVASVLYVLCIAQAGLAAGWSTDIGTNGREFRTVPDKATDVGVVLSVMFLSFAFQVVVPTVRQEMQHPEEMPEAIQNAVGATAGVYMLVGILGYYGWGNGVKDKVLESMTYEDSDGKPHYTMAGILLSVAVISNLFVTLPIILNCISLAAESAAGFGYSPPLRLGLLGTALLLATNLPFFGEVLSLIGALFVTVTMTFIPMACYWKLALDANQSPPPATRLKHAAIVVLGLVAIVFGTIGGWQELMEAVRKAGEKQQEQAGQLQS